MFDPHKEDDEELSRDLETYVHEPRRLQVMSEADVSQFMHAVRTRFDDLRTDINISSID